METGALKKKRSDRTLSFRRKKRLLLGYLEAFHLSQSIDELFHSLGGLLLDEFQAGEVRFSLLDVRKKQLKYHLPETLKGTLIQPGQGYSGQAIAGGRTLLLPRDSSAPHSALVTPLERDNRLIGSVEVIAARDSHDFDEQDRDYLEALAPHMAIAVNHFVLSHEAELKGQIESRLKEISRRINTSLDLDEILEEILENLKGLLPYDAGAIFLFATGQLEEQIAYSGYSDEDRQSLVEKAHRIQQTWDERGPTCCILSTGDCQDVHLCVRPDLKSEVLIPLRSAERLVGLFSLANNQAEAYSDADLGLLETFGNQAASAIERARLHKSMLEKSQLEQEVRIAREIQLRFLPSRMPAIPGLELAARHIASPQMVSGDYFDFIPIVFGQWGLVVGDVSGKGISAGLIMSAFRASLLAEIRNNFNISTILSKVNRLLWETTDSNRFVTAFYGVFDETNRVLTYSNAGHNPPLLLRAGAEMMRLEAGGTVLGAFQESAYFENRINLQAGDTMLLYTDGLSEAHDKRGAELGLSGLERLLRRHASLGAERLADTLVQEATRNTDTQIPEDDATLVVLKLH
ncbi:MAG: SpoIIE family protein phosphatase [Acidobacteriota bacterium]